MSSYQFVNSLASSCYVGRGSSVASVAAAAAAAAGSDLTGMSAADYYASAMSSYQNCYGAQVPVAGQHQQQQQQQHGYTDFGGGGGGHHLHQQQQQQQHHSQQLSAMPMSPMSNGVVGVDFTMQQQQQAMQSHVAQPQMQQQQLQQMRGPSVQQQQRLNNVASTVHLGKSFLT